MDKTIIALTPRVYSGIDIQLTIIQRGEKSYINSVNIIYKEKIINKIKLNGVLKENTPENVDSITSSYFNKVLEISRVSIKEVNKEAKKRVASDLMNKFKL
ncbi:hypothetical protein [Gaetbulibacter saemankumensis]|uniref:hypothetical protein n=1 Tax=Gaetbulibacter saemankumensis TaxID=311208 RepID=UPI000421CA64|nr:hypothetical protein [Gaetbulibacter saemankumensis]